jgi:Flp pilus assembly protein protease CpaA
MEAIVIGCLLPSVYSAYTDVKYRMIYDRITIPTLIAGVIYSIYIGIWQNTLLTAAVVFVILFAMALQGGVAGGDVKFSTALAVWFGYPLIIYVIGIGSLLGLIWGIIAFIRKGILIKRTINMARHFYLKYILRVKVSLLPKLPENDEISPEAIPYGPFLVVAAWLVFILQGMMV